VSLACRFQSTQLWGCPARVTAGQGPDQGRVSQPFLVMEELRECPASPCHLATCPPLPAQCRRPVGSTSRRPEPGHDRPTTLLLAKLPPTTKRYVTRSRRRPYHRTPPANRFRARATGGIWRPRQRTHSQHPCARQQPAARRLDDPPDRAGFRGVSPSRPPLRL
jgi:hypothetical protein